MLSYSDPPHCVAAVAGLISWLFLTNCDIYGDFALVLFANAYALLYFQLKTNAAETAFRLTNEIVGCYLLSLATVTIIYRLSPLHPLANHPGPLLWRVSSVPLALVSFRGYRHHVIHSFHERYGKFVRIGPNTLSVNSYDASNVIYEAHNMEKNESYRLPGHVRGSALFFKQTKSDHTARKQIWLQAFTPSAMEEYFPLLERRTWQLTECIERQLDDAGAVDLAECIRYWSYDVMGEMIFGGSNSLEMMKNGDPYGLIKASKEAIALIDSFGQTPWLLDVLCHIPAGRSIHYLRNAIASIMHTRLQAKQESIRDLTSYLLDGHPRTGKKIRLSDLEIDVGVALQLGSDSTGTTLAVAIYFLLTNPPIYRTLRAALDRAYPNPAAQLDKNVLSRIGILDAVILESLRLWSPFFLPRVVPPNGAIIDGQRIPGGTTVALAAYSQQISAENFFPDPLEFRPERWLPGGIGPTSVTNKAALFSFSTGPNMCIAKNFSMHGMRHCLSRLLLTFDMEYPHDFDINGFKSGLRNIRTTVFDKPLIVKMTRRKQRVGT